MRRRRPIDNRRLIAVLVTIACLVAAAWAAIYAASAHERPRVLGRFREPRVSASVSQLEPVAVATDPVTGDVVVIARDRRGDLSQLRLPSEVGVAPGGLRLPVVPRPPARNTAAGHGEASSLPASPLSAP